ncbi:MAG: hypothetical protein JXA92_00985 [candidate division Zixibacteria bacterium]|nr:hypothetical protein [candidate division Zixibacteria bacterium]
MELTFDKIYSDLGTLYLPGFVVFSISFASFGIRQIKQKGLDGIIYLIIALFFIAAHAYFLIEHPFRIFPGSVLDGISFIKWIELILAPPVILVFLISGLYAFIKTAFKEGLEKIFFGLTLYCFLYMLGGAWPLNIKAALAVIWLILFFGVEIKGTPERH